MDKSCKWHWTFIPALAHSVTWIHSVAKEENFTALNSFCYNVMKSSCHWFHMTSNLTHWGRVTLICVFYITTVQDGWPKSAFLTRACFLCTIHLITQYIEPVSEWSCWRMFIETWPHSELTFGTALPLYRDRRFTNLQRTLFIYLINKYISLADICMTVHHWYK